MARFRGGSFELRFDNMPEEAIVLVDDSNSVIDDGDELSQVWGVRVAYDAQEDLSAQENWVSFEGKWAPVFAARNNPPQPISYVAYLNNTTNLNNVKNAMVNNTTTLYMLYEKVGGIFYVTFANLGITQLLAAERIFRITVGDKTDITNLGHILSNQISTSPRLFGYGERKYDYLKDTSGASAKHYLKYRVVPPITKQWDVSGTYWNYKYLNDFNTATLTKVWDLIKTNINSYTSVQTTDTDFFGTATNRNVTLKVESADITALDNYETAGWEPFVYSPHTLIDENASATRVQECVLRVLDVTNIPDTTDTLIKISGEEGGSTLTNIVIQGDQISLDPTDSTRKDVEAITSLIVDTINNTTMSTTNNWIKAAKFGPRSIILSMYLDDPDSVGDGDYFAISISNGDPTSGVEIEHPIFDLEVRFTNGTDDGISNTEGEGYGPGEWHTTDTFQLTSGGGGVTGVRISSALGEIGASPTYTIGNEASPITYKTIDTTAVPTLVMKTGIAKVHNNISGKWAEISNVFTVQADCGTDDINPSIPQPGDIPSRVEKFMKMCAVFERCAIPQYLLKNTLIDLVYRVYNEGEDY